jgi:hypothetical protein
MGLVPGLHGLRLATDQAPVSSVVLIILGALALLVILRAIWAFAMAVLGIRSALDNKGFAGRFWAFRKSRRGKTSSRSGR